MVNLYGRKWTRRELESRIGRIEQIAGIQRFTMKEGPEEGVDSYRIRTGTGLSFWVHPSKGMDISLVEISGTPISWSSSNGDQHPSYYDQNGIEWLKTASGGLLMTCGLTQVGGPGEDTGGNYGLHGRIHHTPARQVSSKAEWNCDEYEMSISGVLEETSIFGYKLRLTRTISCILGGNRINISDKVENIGFQSTPHMMLYHFNFGFPLLSEDTKVRLPEGESFPQHPSMDISQMHNWQEPDPQFNEQVIYHKPVAQKETVTASIYNPSFPIGSTNVGLEVELKWDPQALPNLVQWRMPGAGDHVLGLEPSNCWTNGRTSERENGSLKILEPGEEISYHLELNLKIN